MKSNQRTISLWQDMVDVFESPIWRIFRSKFSNFGDDQRGMDVLLNDGRARLVEPYLEGITGDMVRGKYEHYDGKPGWGGLDVRMLGTLDQTEVVSGHLLLDRYDDYQQGVKKLRNQQRQRGLAK